MGRRIIIGDIHGCFDELTELLGVIGASRDDLIVSVGDMIDRGPKSPEVAEFFMCGGKRLAILGNHERKHLRFSIGLIEPAYFGMNQRLTVMQFAQRHLREPSPSYREALDYFWKLPFYLNFPDALVVHAGVIYGVPLGAQNEKILTGAGFHPANRNSKSGLFRWCDSYPENAKPIIFGHLGIGKKVPWPLPQRKNLWPIDTGCAGGGYLTAIVLPDWRVYRVKSRQKARNEIRRLQ